MSEDQFKLTISIENDAGAVKVTYVDVSREDLLKDGKTAALLQIHDQSIRNEDAHAAE